MKQTPSTPSQHTLVRCRGSSLVSRAGIVGRAFLTTSCILVAVAVGRAESGADADSPSDAPAAQPAGTAGGSSIKLGNVTLSGSLRSRLYVWNWFQPATGENQYEYSGNLLRVGLSEQLQSWDWNAEFAVPLLLGMPTGATDTAPQGALGLGSNYYSANHNSQYAAGFFPKLLYVRFKRLGGVEGQTLQAGRFTFLDGSEVAPADATLAQLKRDRIAQRLLGDFGWSDVGRSFDGVHYSLTRGSNDFTFVSAVPTRGVFQTDGWGWNRVGFAYAAYTHDWGKGRHFADTRLFDVEYDDWRHILKTDNRPAAVRKTDTENIVINTAGGHTLHVITTGAGTLDALAWGAYQTGRWGAQKQRSYAFELEGGFQPAILPPLKPWIRGGFTEGSGDGNPNDNVHETFFQILPTPRPYARFPFFNMMNTQDRYGALILRPHTKLTISSEFHGLRLSERGDLWYSGGGVFQPWTFGYTGRNANGARSLANLYDTQADYRVSRAVSITLYCGYAQGLAVMKTIYPHGKNGQFGYGEVAYRF